MSALLLDTDAFAWTLLQATQLSPAARAALANTARLYTSAITIFEITQKVRIGRWLAMSPLVPNLVAYAQIIRIDVIPLDATVCSAAGSMAWGHKDPFDRMIAATALQLGCPVVSSDAAFDGVVPRVWRSGGPVGRRPCPFSDCRAAHPWSGRRAGT